MKKKLNKRQDILLEIIEELRNELNNKNHIIKECRKGNLEYVQRCSELEEENCKLKKQLSDLSQRQTPKSLVPSDKR